MNASTLVQKLWNYCNILRDDGLSYGDYVEQLTFLLFLKMADEKTKPPFDQKPIIDTQWGWPKRLELQDPAKLKRLIVDLIDKEQWSLLDTDLKGDAYEGLLQDRKSVV